MRPDFGKLAKLSHLVYQFYKFDALQLVKVRNSHLRN